MKIQKYFSSQGILSRREAEAYMKAGKIAVNGAVVKDFGIEVDPDKDVVEVVGGVDEKTTILYHKPRGISSSKSANEGTNIFDLLPEYKHLNTIGRLDKDSEGLILLSNDGVLTRIITGQDHLIEKEYEVEVREQVTQSKINALSQVMILNDGPTLPAKATQLNEHSFAITLKEGRNHQVRRMANKVRLTVTKLKRVRVGKLLLRNIPVGEFLEVNPAEIEKLKAAGG